MAIAGQAPVVQHVLRQHGDEAASLYTTRSFAIAAPHIGTLHLRRLDDRLAAHMRGIWLGGGEGWVVCDALLQSLTPGAAFTSTIQAVANKDLARLDRLCSLAESAPAFQREVISALGWIDATRLQGLVVSLLHAPDSFRRTIALDTCRLHRVDPGGLAPRMCDTNDGVRARTFRAAGELGQRQFVSSCAAAIASDASDCSLWAARSAVLLGDRQNGIDALSAIGLTDGPHRAKAFLLALQAMTPAAAHRVLLGLAADPESRRWLIYGSGIVGDSSYVPWLIDQMKSLQFARLAGEAFSFVTGADLAAQELEMARPENVESGPNDDPDDSNVDMDPDEGLPWPDKSKVERWWAANSHRFQPGQRYFMGAPVTRDHCIDVLKNGYQRQRILAAHYLCLLNPGTPLFNTSAPAWRQQRLLAQM